MSYLADIDGFEGQSIVVKTSFWTGAKLFINGVLAPKGKKRGEMLLKRNDGEQVTATWNPQLFGFDVPQLVVEGKTIKLVEPLKWYQWIWCGLPIALVFVGGALGAIAGMLAFAVNAKVFRSNLNGVLCFLVSGIVSVLAFVVYLLVALIFQTMIR